MTEPTPGQWEVTTGPGTSYFGVGSIDTGENIGVAMSEANARFIAAAPDTLEQRNDLLEALEDRLYSRMKNLIGSIVA